jgi:hypothetical protein
MNKARLSLPAIITLMSGGRYSTIQWLPQPSWIDWSITPRYFLLLEVVIGGLSPEYNSWIKGAYFYHQSIKNMWRYEIIALFRREFQKGNLVMPRNLRHIKPYEAFCSWTSKFYNVTWVVHLNKQSNKMKYNREYLGKYLKRPPIGETRITLSLIMMVTLSLFNILTIILILLKLLLFLY